MMHKKIFASFFLALVLLASSTHQVAAAQGSLRQAAPSTRALQEEEPGLFQQAANWFSGFVEGVGRWFFEGDENEELPLPESATVAPSMGGTMVVTAGGSE